MLDASELQGVAASQRKTETKLQSDIDLRVKRTEFALFDQRSANETLTLKAQPAMTGRVCKPILTLDIFTPKLV
eukprot:4880076-Amphidinium_carterae.1